MVPFVRTIAYVRKFIIFCQFSCINQQVGLLLTKDLIFCDPEDSIKVERFVRIFGRRCADCSVRIALGTRTRVQTL